MPDLAERLFSEGRTIAEVAIYLKVSRNTLSAWLEEGSSETCKDELLVELAQRCTRARADSMGELREIWNNHVLVDPKAAAIEMKAHLPELYDRGSHKTVDVTVTQRKALPDYRTLTPEQLQLKAAYEELEEQLAATRRA